MTLNPAPEPLEIPIQGKGRGKIAGTHVPMEEYLDVPAETYRSLLAGALITKWALGGSASPTIPLLYSPPSVAPAGTPRGSGFNITGCVSVCPSTVSRSV
jgi:hypothetical protein